MTRLQSLSGKTSRQTMSAEFLHDLRTPLNQIIGYSEMLTEQAQEEGQTGFVPDLLKIHTAGQQLLTLLSNGSGHGMSQQQTLTVHSAAHLSEPSPVDTPTTPHSDGQTELEVQTGKTAAQVVAGAEQALILVVDDVEANRDVLARRLQRQGYKVAMAENGQVAMTAVRRQAFDLVLLDIMMPEMDGYQVLQQLKLDETLRHIPVIMISAVDELESVVRCIEMGAEDYLPKPFNPTLLTARISACLEKKHARDLAIHFTEELQESYRRLQEVEKFRDDLTNMIIHDLRTPLTSVITGMQTLQGVGDLDDIQREMVSIAIDGGETLLGMVNDLLDVEKMESGSMQLEYSTVNATKLVADATRQVASLCESKNLTIVPQIASGLLQFPGDENKLCRTLVNLLGNAIKFTPGGGTLIAEARLSQDRLSQNGQSIVFSVSDTGEGIPVEAFDHIFEKFGQVPSRQGGRMMSTGLGLTFCKLAVEAHGGHIGVESVLGQGSTFCFTVPLTPLEQQARLE